MQSRHISLRINRPAADVYRYASDPCNLSVWAAGLGQGMSVEFVAANDLGVLDHVVTLPSGEQVYNPLRVLPDQESSEVVFTLRRSEGMSDGEFDDDAAAVARDLAALKHILEQ